MKNPRLQFWNAVMRFVIIIIAVIIPNCGYAFHDFNNKMPCGCGCKKLYTLRKIYF